MGLSGSDKAYLQARSGIARAGATRCGYFSPNVVLTIDGVDRSAALRLGTLRIHQALNDEPDTASFSLKPGTTIPSAGQHVIIGLGTAANAEFGGQIMRVATVRHQGLFDSPEIRCECKDWTALFDRRLVTQTWENTSATTIATEIVTGFTSGFTTTGIESGLITVPRFVCDHEAPSIALRRLVNEAGGGGYYLTPGRDVRFFSSAGDVGPRARTNPVTLTNTLSTLKQFARERDLTQVRNRTWVRGTSTVLRTPIAVGTDLTAMGFPVVNGWIFDTGGGVVRLGAHLVTYVTCTQQLGPPATTTTGAVSPGDTVVPLADDSVFSGAGWYTIDGQSFFFGTVSVGGSSEIAGIPSSGYGSVQTPIPSGTPVYGCDALIAVTITPTPVELIPAGERVRVMAAVDNSSAQTALALVEGGDGIHEYLLDAPDADDSGATALAQADIDAFSSVAGLVEVKWRTTDLNARPGTSQVFNITGTDALSTTLTITSVDLEWEMDGVPPFRNCTAHNTRLLERIEAITELVKRK